MLHPDGEVSIFILNLFVTPGTKLRIATVEVSGSVVPETKVSNPMQAPLGIPVQLTLMDVCLLVRPFVPDTEGGIASDGFMKTNFPFCGSHFSIPDLGTKLPLGNRARFALGDVNVSDLNCCEPFG